MCWGRGWGSSLGVGAWAPARSGSSALPAPASFSCFLSPYLDAALGRLGGAFRAAEASVKTIPALAEPLAKAGLKGPPGAPPTAGRAGPQSSASHPHPRTLFSLQLSVGLPGFGPAPVGFQSPALHYPPLPLIGRGPTDACRYCDS